MSSQKWWFFFYTMFRVWSGLCFHLRKDLEIQDKLSNSASPLTKHSKPKLEKYCNKKVRLKSFFSLCRPLLNYSSIQISLVSIWAKIAVALFNLMELTKGANFWIFNIEKNKKIKWHFPNIIGSPFWMLMLWKIVYVLIMKVKLKWFNKKYLKTTNVRDGKF